MLELVPYPWVLFWFCCVFPLSMSEMMKYLMLKVEVTEDRSRSALSSVTVTKYLPLFNFK